jgi:serine protease Do
MRRRIDSMKRHAGRIAFGCLMFMLLSAGRAFGQGEGVNLRRTVIVDVVEKTKNAVVYISTEKMVDAMRPINPDPFFSQFARPVHELGWSLGSGFIIHKDGYVVTNHHVIAGAREITVQLDDGQKLPADVINSDPEADLAILKVHADKPLPTLELGDSSDLMIGEPTIAVGNPYGLSHSVSSGILSALHRDITGQNNEVMLHDLMQTDAAINHGNSGGPLLNAYGQVIGINTAIIEQSQNIGFTIQVNRLRDAIPDLMSPEQANKCVIPIKFKETRKIIEPATVEPTVLIDGTDEVVKRIGKEKPRDIVEAYALLLEYKPGETIEIETNKGTREIKGKPAGVPDVIVQVKKKLGLTIEAMTPIQAGKLGTEQETGVLVTAVEKGSIGDVASLQPNDIITLVAIPRVLLGQIQGLNDFAGCMKYFPKKGTVILGIIRPGEQRMGRAYLQLDASRGSGSGEQGHGATDGHAEPGT